MEEKIRKLKEEIKKHGKVAVAFSGGVDSALVLAAACDALGKDNVVAITVKSPLTAGDDGNEASDFAKMLGARHVILCIDPLSIEKVRQNTRDRCYHCKTAIFKAIKDEALKNGCIAVLDGTNADDVKTYRPGIRALSELSIISPLLICGMEKKDVRKTADMMHLPQAKKPAGPCLATRVPYDTHITSEMISAISRGEKIIKSFGISDCRLRHHGDTARIEVSKEEIAKLINDDLISSLKKLGYRFVTADLEGYRSGCFDDDQEKE